MSEQTGFRAADVYNAAVAGFDSAPLSFWKYHGVRTVQRLHLRPGMTVLDVACGTGSSAIPAAQAVGTSGSVTAVDISDGMLDAARAKVDAAGLENIRFVKADMTSLDFPDRSFDAVVCAFGIFFASDMHALVQGLWGMVRPGGKLAVTSWANGRFEPLASALKDSVKKVRPDLVRTRTRSEPWGSIGTPGELKRFLLDCGVEDMQVEAAPYEVKISSPDEWWTIVMGSGSRWQMDAMQPDERESVRRLVDAFIVSKDIASIPANAIYARSQKADWK